MSIISRYNVLWYLECVLKVFVTGKRILFKSQFTHRSLLHAMFCRFMKSIKCLVNFVEKKINCFMFSILTYWRKAIRKH